MSTKDKILVVSGACLLLLSPLIAGFVSRALEPLVCRPALGEFTIFNACYASIGLFPYIMGVIILAATLMILKSVLYDKRKNKPFIAIKWTRSYASKVNKLTLRNTTLAIITASCVLWLGSAGNLWPFMLETIECRKLPVETYETRTEKYYKIPGDADYGVNIFNEYKFCDEQAAVDAGYAHYLRNYYR
ncbi:MAG TPA: hypothetical protein VLA77_01070 [Candidatus Saccharimonadales bacterium]|nr:hypothetical protein [Candidatus Saccharimonadales bacterium]